MQRTFLLGILLPVVSTAIAMLVLTRLRRGDDPVKQRVGWEGALLAVIYAGVQLLLDPWTGFPPANIMQWPPLIALAALLVSLFDGDRVRRLRWVAGGMVVAGAGAVLLLLRPAAFSHLPIGMGILWTGVAVAAWLALVTLWSRTAARVPSREVMTTLAISAGTSAAAMLLFDSLTYAQHIGIIALIMVVMVVMAWLRGMTQQVSRGLARVLAVILPSWWILSTTMSDLPVWGLPLLAGAGASAWVGTIPAVASWAPWKRVVLVGFIAVMVVSPLMGWGIIQSLHQAHGSGEGY
jgi:hypothetical protein